MEVTSGIHAYGLEWPKCTKYVGAQEPLWVHVVDTPDATVLFGTGDETTKDQLLPIATDHDVDQVVVEHGDPDHWEGVPFLRAELDVEVSIPAGDAERMIDAGIEPDRRLEAGRTYWGVEAIAAPGHTPGNMGYLYRDALVAGDIVFGVDSVYTLEYDYSGQLGVVTPDWNSDDEAMRQSVRDFVALDFDAVLVTHGTSVHNGGDGEWEKLVADLDEMT